MITNTNYAFRVNISLDGYARKSDSTACLSRAGAKAIGKEKMAFVEQSITVDDFLFYASSGHSFANLFSFNPDKEYWIESNGSHYKSFPVYRSGNRQGAMKLNFKTDEFFSGSQTIFVDIDDTKYTTLEEYIGMLPMQPTAAYSSFSDNVEKHGKISRRWRLVYVFYSTLGLEDFKTTSKAIHRYIELCTGERMDDNCGTRPSQYMNGGFPTGDLFKSGYIYGISDFAPYEDIDNMLETESATSEFIFNQNMVDDMESMAYNDFMHYNSWRGYTYRTEREDAWERGIYQLTDDNYLQLWYYRETVMDGEHRRRKLFKNACLRRLMKPDIDADTLLFNLYVDAHRFFDNSDGVLTLDCLESKVIKAMGMSEEELREYCSWEIEYWQKNRPMFILNSGVDHSVAEINRICKEVRYKQLDLLYDPTISVQENIARGIDVPQATLYRYCAERWINTNPQKPMTYREKRKVKKAERNGDIEVFKKLYDPQLSLRDNLKVLKKAGIRIKSVETVKNWVNKYYEPKIEKTAEQLFCFPSFSDLVNDNFSST